MIRARGPCSATLSRMPASSERMYAIIGMPNAAVLPEPVSAMPMMSRRSMPIGIAFWRGRGKEGGGVVDVWWAFLEGVHGRPKWRGGGDIMQNKTCAGEGQKAGDISGGGGERGGALDTANQKR